MSLKKRLDKIEGHIGTLNEENDTQNILLARVETKVTILLWGLPTSLTITFTVFGLILRYVR